MNKYFEPKLVNIDSTLLSGVIRSQTAECESSLQDAEYQKWAWDWMDRILSESADFDYLFVGGHYQVLDVRNGCKINVDLIYFKS